MLILVDTSVWIDLLGPKPRFHVTSDDILTFATCGPIIQEIFQGLRDTPRRKLIQEQFLALPRFGDPLLFFHFLKAADIYSVGRRKGFTLRSSTDCLIAAIAIEHDIPVWHNDRDFKIISKFTSLRTLEK